MSDTVNRPGYPITTGTPPRVSITGTGNRQSERSIGKSFQEMLSQSLQTVQQTRQLSFSKHAMGRVERRGIEISPDTLGMLEQAVDTAKTKGITDSLILLDNTAYIVNIPNRVVVTVVDGSDTEQTVFTNIDGAVIL